MIITIHPPIAEQVRTHVLMAALNVCQAQLQHLIRAGKVPRPDFYQHGHYSYWHISTIRRWRSDVALAVEIIKRIPPSPPPPKPFTWRVSHAHATEYPSVQDKTYNDMIKNS